ncbi:MAG: protein kinase [Deltaproteobacteria bacterium]|nr:protein kinase [Deltaproteobacteria bacterium]
MALDEPSFADVEFPIGHYRVLNLLGRGGIGEVFVAHRRGGAELCALKRLRAEVASKEVARVRIKREAHLAAYLNHPNVCRVLDAGYEDDCFFLATEFVPGVDLDRVIQALASRRLALAVDMVLAVALPALAGLQHAHTATGPDGRPLAVVHRDLSPRNIMVTFDGRVKIIDFGVAHAQVDDYRTAPGVLVGTPKYLSPEQALGAKVDARSDLYSLAAVIYEMLSGRSLVRGGNNLVDTLQEIVARVPRPVSSYNPQVSEAMEAVLNRALAKDPAERYGSARELQDALRQAGGPPASREQLGTLVRELFPNIASEMEAMAERAREVVTPVPRPASVVDPFSATAVSQMPQESQLPTRVAEPDAPEALTRTVFREELAQADLRGETVLPTRAAATVAWVGADPTALKTVPVPGSVDAPFVPTRTAPSPSASVPLPRRRRAGQAVAVAGAAVAVAATGVALALNRPPPEQAPVDPPPVVAPQAAPRAELPPQVRVEPRAPEVPVEPVHAHRPAPAPVHRAPEAPRPARSPARPAPRPADDPLARRLRGMTKALEAGEALDPVDLAQAVEQLVRRADATGDDGAQRQAQAARDCLASCPDQERMLASARKALSVVRAAEHP